MSVRKSGSVRADGLGHYGEPKASSKLLLQLLVAAAPTATVPGTGADLPTELTYTPGLHTQYRTLFFQVIGQSKILDLVHYDHPILQHDMTPTFAARRVP